MKSVILMAALTAGITACTPVVQPICPREHQPWDKFGTVEDMCMPTAPLVATVERDNNKEGPTKPDKEDEPTRPYPEPEKPNNPEKPDPKPEKPDTKPEKPDPKPEKPDPKPEKPNKEKGNNGWGNGDQKAPGKSGGNNNAENSNREHHKHGKGNPD